MDFKQNVKIKNTTGGFAVNKLNKMDNAYKLRKNDNSDQKEILRAFNNQMVDFFNDLKTVLTNKNKFSMFWMALKGVILIKPREIILRWDYYINTGGLLKRPLRNQIKNYSEDFFKSIEYTKEERDTFSKSSQILLNVIEEIKMNIGGINTSNKKKIFHYLNNLCDLTEIYFKDI